MEGGPSPRPRSSTPIASPPHTTTQVAAPGRCGRGAGRPDHRQRVRRHQRHPHPPARHHPQPLEPRPHAGGVVGWDRGGGGGRPAPHRLGRRRRRFDPHPRRLHGHVRTQVELRAHPQGPVRAPDPPHRHRRLHQPVGARHGALVRRVQRLRPPRHPQPAPRGGMGGRAREPPPGACGASGRSSRSTSVWRSSTPRWPRSVHAAADIAHRRRRAGARRRRGELPPGAVRMGHVQPGHTGGRPRRQVSRLASRTSRPRSCWA